MIVSSDDDEDLATREVRRRSRLLGDTESVSSFDELFASLREEEERAIAAAEAEAMSSFLSELDGDLLDEAPAVSPSRRTSSPPRYRESPREGGAGTRRGGSGADGGLGGGSRAARRAMPLYNPSSAREGMTASSQQGQPPRAQASPSGAPSRPPTRPPPGSFAPSAASSSGFQASSGGLEAASVGGQLNVIMPTKVMVFIDGTWLYYQLFGRGRRCAITRQWGDRWWETHHIDYSRLPQLISDHLSAELARTQPYAQRAVEVVRVLVFSSFRPDDEDVVSQRERMFRAMQELHFEVHLGEYVGGQEKCVDIALAVDMMHYATVPNAFDIAVLISGDRDFIPALVRTRQKGKRVAVCSMRNSASTDYEDPEANIKDFGVLWLDDHLEDLVVPIHPSLLNERPAMARYLRSAVCEYLDAEAGGEAALDALAAHLDDLALGEGASALSYIENEFEGLLPFLGLYPEAVRLERRGVGKEARLMAMSVAAMAADGGGAAPEATSAASAVSAASAAAPTRRKGSKGGRAEPASSSPGIDEEDDKDGGGSAEGEGDGDGEGQSEFDMELEAILAEVGDEASTAAEAAAAEAERMDREARDGPPADEGSLPPKENSEARAGGQERATRSKRSGRSDGALLVDGSLIALLEADAFSSDAGDGTRDALTVADLADLTVPQLKLELRSRGRPATGTKPSLLRNLLDAIKEDGNSEQQGPGGQQ
jgi:uncharacterized LabA/DUF88 family protein